MTDYVPKFFKSIREREDGLYSAIVRLASEQYLIYYLCYKTFGDASPLEKEIMDCISDATTIDLHDGLMSYDAGLLSIAKDERGRGKVLFSKAKYIFETLENSARSKEEDILLDIYKCHKKECEYMLNNIDNTHDALELAYNEFCKTEDPKKAIVELYNEKQVAMTIIRARIKARMSEGTSEESDSEKLITN